MDILFKNITAVTMQDETALENAFVHVSEGKIAYVGTERPEAFSGEEIDGKGKVLMPGIVNGHTHLPMTVLRGYADDYDLQTWLQDYIFPIEDKLDSRCVRAAALLGIAEAIASGTTSVSDMYSFCDEIAIGVAESGIKANISRGTVLFSEELDFETYPACVEMRELFEKWHGFDGGRILIDASIHAEYTSNDKLWSALSEFALNNGLGMHIHLSETKNEHDSCIEKYGVTPAQILDCYGVWNTRAIAAHCVWLTEEDMDLLKKRGVSVIHNPVSNQKLASGIAPVPEMIRRGLNVSLGTDGVSSNNTHDMFEEIKSAAILHKAKSGDPLAVSAFNALEMATVNGALAQGRQNECGKIAVGFDADLIMLDFDRPHLFPCHNPISNLVYAAKGSDVVLNMVKGKILYKNGEFKTIDIDKVYYELKNYVLPMLFA